jgi:membrane associated rhomboid family serine protease
MGKWWQMPVENLPPRSYVQAVMIEDRHYMRAAPLLTPRSATLALLILNVVAFIIQNFVYYYVPAFPLDDYFALSVRGLAGGFVWQLLTFQLLHGGLLHLVLNCFVIYMFGSEIEEALGKRRALALYFASGVGGGLLQVGGGLLWPGHFGGAVVGASAGAFGLIAAFAVLYPERPLTLLLFFVIPVTLRAKYLLLFSALLALFGIVVPGDHIAHAAHLGGMLTGIFFIRRVLLWRWPRLRFGSPARQPPLPRELVNVQAQRKPRWRRPDPLAEPELPTEEFLSREVDPILDKISAQGIQSLTERERKTLEAARTRMTNR